MPYRLSEPNVLLLDMAEYRFDGKDGDSWKDKEEILRLDNECRKAAGYPLRMEAFAQPWTSEKAQPEHVLEMRFTIRSEIQVTDASLALEESGVTTIYLNGEEVEKKDCGYFVDECIRRFPLPAIPAGTSELILKLAYSRDTNPEWCYLLGSFGVRAEGSEACLTKLPDTVAFGDYSTQGFPFYAGNMIYEAQLDAEEDGEYVIAAEKFRAPLLKVEVDGEAAGRIALSPYQLSLGYLKKGRHSITLTSYGNRYNAFGTVHICDEKNAWAGPNAWRTEGAGYSYEYQLKRMGILAAPRVFRVE